MSRCAKCDASGIVAVSGTGRAPFIFATYACSVCRPADYERDRIAYGWPITGKTTT